MPEPVVIVSKDSGIATVTLNRPEKLNALNRELRAAFCQVMQELHEDRETRVVIITGAGRAFCAGLDLRELGSSGIRDDGNATFITVVEDMEVPVKVLDDACCTDKERAAADRRDRDWWLTFAATQKRKSSD